MTVGKRAIPGHIVRRWIISFSKIVSFLVAVCMASTIALMVWYVAHYLFGISLLDIQTSALTVAAIFALLVATKLFNKKSK
jgi:hypothetical protein